MSGLPTLLVFPACQAPVTPLAAFANMPRRVSGPVREFGEPCLLNDQLFHSHQSPCVPTPIPAGSCHVLPFLPETDGNPRKIYNLSGNSQTTTLSMGMTC